MATQTKLKFTKHVPKPPSSTYYDAQTGGSTYYRIVKNAGVYTAFICEELQDNGETPTKMDGLRRFRTLVQAKECANTHYREAQKRQAQADSARLPYRD